MKTAALRIRQPSARQVVVGLITLGCLWRVMRYVLAFPLWGDEAFVGVNFFVRDFAGMIRPLEWGQIVPLAFSWATLAITRAAGVSEYTLRLVSLLSGLAALGVFLKFASAVFPRRTTLLAVGFLAASYYVVRHGAEVKPYALDLLISVTLTSLGWAVHERPSRTRVWAGLMVLSFLAAWCSYPSVFVGAAVVCVLALRAARPVDLDPVTRRRLRVRTAALAAALMGGFVWMYLTYGQPHAQFAARLPEIAMWAPFFPPWDEPAKLPLWLAYVHTGPMFAYPHGGNPPGSILTLILVIIGAVSLGRRRPRLVLLLLGPFVFNLIAASMKAYPYGGSARTSLFLAPAICSLAALGLSSLLRRLPQPHANNAIVIAGLALGVLPIAGVIGDVRKPYQSIESRTGFLAVRDLARRTAPRDTWVVFNAVAPCTYAPYLGEWRGTGGQFVFDIMRFAPVPVAWAPRPEAVTVHPGGRLWLISMRGVRVDFPEAQFGAYLGALRARFGEPVHQRTLLKSRDGRDEAIDVFAFEPR